MSKYVQDSYITYYQCLYIAYIVRFNPWTEVSTQYY